VACVADKKVSREILRILLFRFHHQLKCRLSLAVYFLRVSYMFMYFVPENLLKRLDIGCCNHVIICIFVIVMIEKVVVNVFINNIKLLVCYHICTIRINNMSNNNSITV
jgi:hypothetical protein